MLRPPPPEHGGIHSFAHGCYAMDATAPGSEDTRWLEAIDWEDGEETREGYAFTARALGQRPYSAAGAAAYSAAAMAPRPGSAHAAAAAGIRTGGRDNGGLVPFFVTLCNTPSPFL